MYKIILITIALVLVGGGCVNIKDPAESKKSEPEMDLKELADDMGYEYIYGYKRKSGDGGCNLTVKRPCTPAKWTNNNDEIKYWNEMECDIYKYLGDSELHALRNKICDDLFDKIYYD